MINNKRLGGDAVQKKTGKKLLNHKLVGGDVIKVLPERKLSKMTGEQMLSKAISKFKK